MDAAKVALLVTWIMPGGADQPNVSIAISLLLLQLKRARLREIRFCRMHNA